jgi:type I restriction enzyme S subunit
MRLLGTVPATTVKSSATHFKTGDVLYGRLRPYLNKVIRVDFEGLASAEFIPLTTPEGVDSDFLKYRLNSAEFVAFTSKLDTGDRPRVDYDQIGEFRFHLPPTGTQHRIAEAIESYLTRLDAAVASLERVQKNLERYRASVLKAAVEGRLVPTEADLARKEGRSYEPASELLERILAERKTRWIEDAAEKARAKAEAKALKAGKPWTPEDNAKALEKAQQTAKSKYKEPEAPDLSALQTQAGTTDLPALPEGWCWVALETLCLSITDGDHAAPPQVPNGIAFLVIGDVRDGAVRFDNARYVPQKYYENLNGERRPQRGDILYTVTGSFGIAVDVDTERPFCVQRHIGILKPAQNMNTRLLSRILASAFVYRQAQATATGTAQKTVGLKNLRRFAIPLPPEREQIRILKAVEAADSVTAHALDAVGRAVLRGQRLRQSILKWAFAGKLVEQDPDDEPASALLDRIRSERAGIQR